MFHVQNGSSSNYLAVDLDKVRGASSLIIWEISTPAVLDILHRELGLRLRFCLHLLLYLIGGSGSLTPAGIIVASKVNRIATDPYRIAWCDCFGDGVVRVWDARRLRQSL